jgi:hypothetical protein
MSRFLFLQNSLLRKQEAFLCAPQFRYGCALLSKPSVGVLVRRR